MDTAPQAQAQRRSLSVYSDSMLWSVESWSVVPRSPPRRGTMYMEYAAPYKALRPLTRHSNTAHRGRTTHATQRGLPP